MVVEEKERRRKRDRREMLVKGPEFERYIMGGGRRRCECVNSGRLRWGTNLQF